MFLVVAYDITNDRQRTRLHKQLKGFGTPVQYSVFECVLDERRFQELQAVVRKTIDATQDLVRYYRLCESCRTKILAINGVVTSVEQTVII
jgi:CRISPR-associated protein Cas2